MRRGRKMRENRRLKDCSLDFLFWCFGQRGPKGAKSGKDMADLPIMISVNSFLLNLFTELP